MKRHRHPTGRLRPPRVAPAGQPLLTPVERSRSIPDLRDTNPDHVPDAPGGQPASAASGHDPKEVRLKDHLGRLRPPAYILIALVIALGSILFLIGGVTLAPS